MRRVAAILLMLCFLAIGSGAAEYAHNLQHDHEDAAIAAAEKAAGRPVKDHPQHDDSNCAVHAQLHMPFVAAGWIPILICLGLFVAFLTEIKSPLVSQRALLRIDCRGPPASC